MAFTSLLILGFYTLLGLRSSCSYFHFTLLSSLSSPFFTSNWKAGHPYFITVLTANVPNLRCGHLFWSVLHVVLLGLWMSAVQLVCPCLTVQPVQWTDTVQGLGGSRHSHTRSPRGDAGPRNPEEYQLGRGKRLQWPFIISPSHSFQPLTPTTRLENSTFCVF